MKLIGRMRGSRFLPLLAAIVALGALGYFLAVYVRARAIAAVSDAAASAGLELRADLTSVWPGQLSLHDAALSADSQAWSLQVSSVDVRYSPALGTPTRIELHVPEQRATLRAGSTAWKGEVSASARLTRSAQASPRVELLAAAISLRDGELRTSEHTTAGLQLQLTLQGAPDPAHAARHATASEPLASVNQLVVGTAELRGQAGAALLELLHAEGAVRWLFPQALGARFHARANTIVSSTELRLVNLHATCSDISIDGELAWQKGAARGFLLLKTEARRVGLDLVNGEVSVDLSPSADWLGQRSARPASHAGLASHVY